MPNLRTLQAELLNDNRITFDEVNKIKAHIESDGQLDHEDVKFLVELMSNAESVCPEFDRLFFPALRAVLLEDGKIGLDEQYQLLRMLYADGHVRDSEKQFIQDLYHSVDERTPEFEELCETAMGSPAKDWCTGGRAFGSSADASA
ncbi:MAG: hypothetical protein AAFX06_00180 [Planctomycetota bacterium]